jgi:hypothetical protein
MWTQGQIKLALMGEGVLSFLLLLILVAMIARVVREPDFWKDFWKE